jgi:glycosyltransferase involved in cell wall biosynthesis
MPAPVIAARLLGLPALVVARESLRDNPILKSIVPKRLIIGLFKRWATVIVSVSRYVDGQWGGGTVVAASGIGDASSPTDKPSPGAAGSSRGSREFALHVVMLGTLSPEKGQVDAIAAVRQVLDAGEEISLTLAGGGPDSYRQHLVDMVGQLGLRSYVTILDPQPEPQSLIQSADLALVCSRNEAFGRVTVEALEMGTPVLGYSAGGTAELLSHGGGFLVPPDASALADKMLEIVRDPSMLVRAHDEALQLQLADWRTRQSSDVAGFIVGQS